MQIIFEPLKIKSLTYHHISHGRFRASVFSSGKHTTTYKMIEDLKLNGGICFNKGTLVEFSNALVTIQRIEHKTGIDSTFDNFGNVAIAPCRPAKVKKPFRRIDEPFGNTISPSKIKLKQIVFDRDGNKCLRCFGTFYLTIDHVIPVSLGGHKGSLIDISNLQTLCLFCNGLKADEIIDYRYDDVEYIKRNGHPSGFTEKEKLISEKNKSNHKRLPRSRNTTPNHFKFGMTDNMVRHLNGNQIEPE